MFGFPHGLKLFFMVLSPFLHQLNRFCGKVTLQHLHCGNFKQSVMFALYCMYVRWIVLIPEENFNYYSIESCDLRHFYHLLSIVELCRNTCHTSSNHENFMRLLCQHSKTKSELPGMPIFIIRIGLVQLNKNVNVDFPHNSTNNQVIPYFIRFPIAVDWASSHIHTVLPLGS